MIPLVERASAEVTHDGAGEEGQGRFFYSFDLDKVVPPDHLVRQIDGSLDLGCVHEELTPYYSDTHLPSIDPVLMIRMPDRWPRVCARGPPRARQKERDKDVYDHLVAEWQAWNASMLPEIAESFTRSFTDDKLADPYGRRTQTRRPIRLSLYPPAAQSR